MEGGDICHLCNENLSLDNNINYQEVKDFILLESLEVQLLASTTLSIRCQHKFQ